MYLVFSLGFHNRHLFFSMKGHILANDVVSNVAYEVIASSTMQVRYLLTVSFLHLNEAEEAVFPNLYYSLQI